MATPDIPLGTVSFLRRGPRSEPEPDWEARRHALEAAFWAAHLQEFEACLARLRRIRGDARTTQLVRDVLAKVEDTQGTEAALLERGLLLQRWRVDPYGRGS